MIAKDHALVLVSPERSLVHRLKHFLESIAEYILAWRKREHQRTQVARMSERDIADFGMTKQQLEFELERPIARAIRWL